ncbi:FAD-dependent oxidoreductase [Candidatus Binatia bacterium]|nr:FAD-dependent oxidoreductase [Candidatus Binatia bacterium]
MRGDAEADVDLLIVGAGIVGCTVAERAAALRGWRSLVVDRRRHVGGNCHDALHASGVLVHSYGPHYFRTDSDDVLAYLSRFTEWIPGRYVVKVATRGRLFDFPINLTTLEQVYGRAFDADEARLLLDELRDRSIVTPRSSEELVLSRVGREFYDLFYAPYTRKQWGMSPAQLDVSVCGRVPVRFTRDERYVDQRHQVMPRDGFTRMFERMLASPLITVLLGCDFAELRGAIRPRVATLYTGPIDAYFDHRLGRLAWRSLDFELVAYEQQWKQPCVQINYPGAEPYTRSVEYKHVTGQRHPQTVVGYEYPRASGDPFYPVPSARGRRLYAAYAELAEHARRTERTYFAGRLATYAYLNMDQATAAALEAFAEIERDWLASRVRHASAGRG